MSFDGHNIFCLVILLVSFITTKSKLVIKLTYLMLLAFTLSVQHEKETQDENSINMH